MNRELTATALACPAMIRRIRLAMRLAALGKGHEMGGHGNRAYVPNRKGHNVIRVDWRGGEFVIYGRGCTPINQTVKAAFQLAQRRPVMTMINQRPYTVDVAIINPNGHKCRFPVRAWASNPLDARRSAMDKATANGHNVYGYHSVALA